MRRGQTAERLVRKELRLAAQLWPGQIAKRQAEGLEFLLKRFHFSVAAGDLQLLGRKWYVTHSGLLRLAHRRRCCGIRVQVLHEFCEPAAGRWVFRATLLSSSTCRGFVGYGDAEPSNVSPAVRGAEMRVAETRAVNRALRKAYGIGLCSVEEIGSTPLPAEPVHRKAKRPPTKANARDGNGQPKLRDRLCQLIRQHQLDPGLVKLYAAEFCGVQELRAASRDRVEDFVKHVAELAANDRDQLLAKLNSYAKKQAGAA